MNWKVRPFGIKNPFIPLKLTIFELTHFDIFLQGMHITFIVNFRSSYFPP